jgi:hypothetical protein
MKCNAMVVSNHKYPISGVPKSKWRNECCVDYLHVKEINVKYGSNKTGDIGIWRIKTLKQ